MYVAPLTFARRELEIDDADYAIIGIPYDSSQSYRVGSRLAPNAIRETSREIEDYDFEEEKDVLELRICDLGNVDVSYGNFEETCSRVEDTLKDILSKKVIPVSLGGEHTISYSVIRCLPKDIFCLVLDAHLDFRDEYLGEKFSHACVNRRIFEHLGKENVLVVGVRSASKEELKDANKIGLDYISYFDFEKDKDLVHKRISDKIEGRNVYLSLDMDAMDPKEAPGVCNPEPLGFGYRDMVHLSKLLRNCNLIGTDITEITPFYDNYVPVLASKIIFNILQSKH
ncbi:MAG: agmatinase [Candidatus Hydrothermarchaeales archaeon]